MDDLKITLRKFSNDILKQSIEQSSEVLVDRNRGNIKYYQNNFLFNHLDHLENVFKATAQLLGLENFKYFGRIFLLESPPRETDVHNYGRTFPEFLKSREELAEIHYLVYLAQLDWFWFEQAGKEINLPVGTYRLWNAILDNEEISDFEIDETKTENILYK